MKKALILGVTGQDGSYLADFLLKKDYEVFGSYRRTSHRQLERLEAMNIFGKVKLISSYSSNQMIKFRLNNIGFVFQSYNLIPVLTAKENIEMVMLMQGYNKKDMEKRSSDLLNEVGMGDMSKRRPSELSGGQQQRVAVARSLASKPKFILADEPTANLDSKSTAKLLDIMSRLNKQEKITFVFSTHDQRVIDRARRVVTLEDGKIIKDIKK